MSTSLGCSQLHAFVADLVARGAGARDIRDDIDPGELASYCLYPLTAAGSLPSQAAVRRGSSPSPWPGCAPRRRP